MLQHLQRPSLQQGSLYDQRKQCTVTGKSRREPRNTPKGANFLRLPLSPEWFQEFRNINCWERGCFGMFQGYENSLTEGSCLQVCTSLNHLFGGDHAMQMYVEFGGTHRYKLFKIECQDQGMLAYRHFPTPPLPARLAFKDLLDHSQCFPKKRSGQGKLLYTSSWYWESH